jgi:YVTN family beta-propeller protein
MKKATLSLALLALTLQVHAATPYSVKTQYPIAGTEGWDYLTVDSEARRLYVSHGVRVEVLNADTGAQIGKIEDTPGVHGIAIAHKQNHGFTSNGKDNTVSMFDLKTLALIKKINVGQGPNGIFFDAASKHVFTDNHGSHDITVLDAETGNVVGTVAIEGSGTGMAFGKDGLGYVVVKNKNEIAVFDPVKLDVKRRIPLPGVQSPSDWPWTRLPIAFSLAATTRRWWWSMPSPARSLPPCPRPPAPTARPSTRKTTASLSRTARATSR